jgi:hypothetical protein
MKWCCGQRVAKANAAGEERLNTPELDELELGVLLAQVFVRVVEEWIVERDHDHVDALPGQLLHNGATDPRGRPRHQRPLRVVPLLQVVLRRGWEERQ